MKPPPTTILLGPKSNAVTSGAKDLKPNPIDVKLVPIKQDDKPTGQTNIKGKEINFKLSIVEDGDHYLLTVIQS